MNKDTKVLSYQAIEPDEDTKERFINFIKQSI